MYMVAAQIDSGRLQKTPINIERHFDLASGIWAVIVHAARNRRTQCSSSSGTARTSIAFINIVTFSAVVVGAMVGLFERVSAR